MKSTKSDNLTACKYRILSIDGGGIRGIYAARLLSRLVSHILESYGYNFLEGIDLFAGTSSGGIIALGLAHGLSPLEMVALFKDQGSTIFWSGIVQELFPDLKVAERYIKVLYDIQSLRKVLLPIFGTVTLDKLKAKVIVPTFDLDNEGHLTPTHVRRSWNPKFFHNFPGSDSDGDQLAIDVAVRTSAAPTYFNDYQGYVDGGMVANNPSMAALAQAIDGNTGKQKLEDICLFSLGTGAIPKFIEGKDHDWGMLRWAPQFVSLMIEGSMGVADYQCKRLLDERYHRLAPDLAEIVELDAVEKIDFLLQQADEVNLEKTADWINAHFQN